MFRDVTNDNLDCTRKIVVIRNDNVLQLFSVKHFIDSTDLTIDCVVFHN